MKIAIKEARGNEHRLPCLLKLVDEDIGDTTIVIHMRRATEHGLGDGIVIYSSTPHWEFGFRSTTWNMSKLTKFNGSITISE